MLSVLQFKLSEFKLRHANSISLFILDTGKPVC